jgi:beta-fructofuranosidase
MWECPDLFFLDGTLCLICCPQGVTQQGVNYANVHQCTFMKIDADFENRKFRVIEEAPFQQVDRGFDFYAQSFEDEQERRILIGWMGIPEADYTNPTTEQGWQHALTLPRELHVRNGRLIQQPIKELLDLRAEHAHFATKEDLNQADSLLLENSCGFPVFETELTFSDCKQMELALRDGVTLSFSNGVLTLDLKKGGFGRTSRSVELTSLSQLRIYSDTTSLEIFVNGGEEVFTTRLYSQISDPSNDHDLSTNTNARPLALTGDCSATVDVWKLRAFEVSRTQN